QLGNCIGRGQFGSVYKALNLVTGQMVAVKRIKIDGLKDTEMDILMQEVDLLKSLAHPSIVKYEGFIRSSGYLNIILEFVENGSLLTTLKSFGTFPEKLVVAYVVKILEGLVYLHGKEVVHCDLKAANILTTKNGNVKLSDFGVSLNLKVKESDFGAVAGTPNWMAPEVIELKGASPASDIWSLGCTVIEMLTGQPPYAELLPLTTLFRIVEDERPPLPSNLSMDLLDFLCQCFQKDPSLRPSAGALGRHIWIKRNFTSRELKPMDSLPYMKRKSMEPREKLLIAAALEGGGSAAKRASTPLGLSSGAPPPAASATAMNASGRSFRRGSVDSASGYYSSSTVPAPTTPADRHPEFQKGGKAPSQHTFVKSSFAKRKLYRSLLLP
ncbi:MAG: kinase-like domain-containing protein, partial [Linnemannia elongata]